MSAAVAPVYKIPEIATSDFLTHIRPLYDLLEGKKTSKSEEDPFAKRAWMSYYGKSEADWVAENRMIQIRKVLTMELGNFHQNMMGSLPGWVNYKIGHASGCDIGRADDTIIAEIKNNTNTMNSSSKESVVKKLQKQVAAGKRALLIVVNGDISHRTIDGVEWISGRDFYAEATGRPEFIDDLLTTLLHCFTTYKTYAELAKALR